MGAAALRAASLALAAGSAGAVAGAAASVVSGAGGGAARREGGAGGGAVRREGAAALGFGGDAAGGAWPEEGNRRADESEAEAAAEQNDPMPLWPFDPTLARAFAAFTQASYCGADPQLLTWTCGPCEDVGFQVVPGSVRFVEHAEFFQPRSTFIYVARVVRRESRRATPGLADGGACVLAFRGTSTFTNWLRDAEFWARPLLFPWCEGCRVEAGFFTVLQRVLPRLLIALVDLGCLPTHNRSSGDNFTSSLFITGHSLGAAVATLAMCVLDEAGFKVQVSYNFESPRVGNQAFASVFSKVFSRQIPVYRVTHWRDPVVHLPPRGMFLYSYVHVKDEVFFDRDGNWHVCPLQEDPRCADRFPLISTVFSEKQHCASPLVSKGRICDCPIDTATPRAVELLV